MTAPRAALALALGLALAHPGLGNDEEFEHLGDSAPEGKADAVTTSGTLAGVTPEALTTDTSFTHIEEDSSQLEFTLMVFIPLAVLVLLLLSVVLAATYFKRKRTKQEPSSQGSQSALQTYELGCENLKVPIFEEDTPSVMEIEMEELDKWMNSLNRNADRECLPTLKEEMEPSHSPSDNEL
uniref:Transmembrane protein 154 n=1 Tax=Jaculus jaculus TaxID=51337 RepID=A0A8C5LFA7_JACJA